MSDDQLNARYRATAVYKALRVTISQEGPEIYEATPSMALVGPAKEEVESRWEGKSPEEIKRIMLDYEWECETLKGLDLDGEYEKIRELVAEDLQWERTQRF
jgi:hypothetical protein